MIAIQMFIGKAKSLPLESAFPQELEYGGSKYSKHSSLLLQNSNYYCKKFYSTFLSLRQYHGNLQ